MSHSSSNRFATLLGFISIVLLVIATSLCFIIPKGDEVLWINGNYSAFQDILFSSVTWIGKSLVFVILIAMMFFFRFNFALLLGAAFFLNSALVLFFKRIVFPDMLRPTTWLDHSLLHFVNGVEVQTLYSFPSGHTATAFAMAITLSLCLKNKWWSALFLTIAFLVGYSRIYLLQHHLVDVVAGAFIGITSSFVVYYLKPATLVQRIHKILQTQSITKEGSFVFPPSFLVNSRRMKRWVDRVLSEA